MANINERRAFIKSILDKGDSIDVYAVIELFDSSYPAVMNDISIVTSGKPAYTKKQTVGQNTRARKVGASGRLKEREWQAVLKKHGHSCVSCGATQDLCIDHIIPLSKGGANTADNIQPLCRSCNSRKGNRV